MTIFDLPAASNKHYLANFVETGYDHIMVDIETEDNKPTSIIRSVAIVAFDPYDVNTTPMPLLHIHIDRNIQYGEGRTRSKDTMLWWSEQSIDAQIRSLEGQLHAVSPEGARELIGSIIEDYRNIWANGPDFDCVILANFMGPNFKWPFWKHRCVRTMKNVFSDAVATVPKPLCAHDALEDCLYQIQLMRAVYSSLSPRAANTLPHETVQPAPTEA